MHLCYYAWCGDHAKCVILHMYCQIKGTASGLRYVNSGLCQVQRTRSFSDSVSIVQISVPVFLLQIPHQLDVRRTTHLLPNAAYMSRHALCQLWSLSNPMKLLYSIFRPENSVDSISAAIGEMSTNGRALFSTYAAKYRVQNPPCAKWNLVSVRTSVFAVL